MTAAVNTSIRLLRQNTVIIGIKNVQTKNYSCKKPFTYNLASLERGTGGRSSFNGLVATIFGATGFIGRYVCSLLGEIGTQLILPYRGDTYEPMKLKICGDLGQVYFVPYHLRDEESIKKAIKYSNVVINLVGRDWETKNFKFNDVHVDGARTLARLAREAGVERLIHISALNASESPKPIVLRRGSKFLVSKFEGESAVLKEFPEATIFRPSDVYGQEDRFVRYYAHFWRRQAQYLPLWKKGEHTIKQPVYVCDVANGIIAAIKDPDTKGKIYQAVGPKRYLLSELVDYFYRIMRKDKEWGYWRYDLRWDPIFKMKISLSNLFSLGEPLGNLHWEKIEREHTTDDVKPNIPTLQDLGVTLATIEERMPWEFKPWTYGLYHGNFPDEPVPSATPPKVAS